MHQLSRSTLTKLSKLYEFSKKIFDKNLQAKFMRIQLENMEYNDETYYGGQTTFVLLGQYDLPLEEITVTQEFLQFINGSEFWVDFDEQDYDDNFILIEKDGEMTFHVNNYDRETRDFAKKSFNILLQKLAS